MDTQLAYSVKDAAALLGIGRTKIYQLITAGEIKTYPIGSRRLVPAAELEHFVAERLEAA